MPPHAGLSLAGAGQGDGASELCNGLKGLRGWSGFVQASSVKGAGTAERAASTFGPCAGLSLRTGSRHFFPSWHTVFQQARGSLMLGHWPGAGVSRCSSSISTKPSQRLQRQAERLPPVVLISSPEMLRTKVVPSLWRQNRRFMRFRMVILAVWQGKPPAVGITRSRRSAPSRQISETRADPAAYQSRRAFAIPACARNHGPAFAPPKPGKRP